MNTIRISHAGRNTLKKNKEIGGIKDKKVEKTFIPITSLKTVFKKYIVFPII